jgi:hypothetical protein
MNSDETIALHGRPEDEKDVFAIGDSTIFALRNQKFDTDDLGTMIVREVPPRLQSAVMTTSSELESDPIRRLEQKLDAALMIIARLQQRLDSIDSTLARAINR